MCMKFYIRDSRNDKTFIIKKPERKENVPEEICEKKQQSIKVQIRDFLYFCFIKCLTKLIKHFLTLHKGTNQGFLYFCSIKRVKPKEASTYRTYV